MSTINNAPAVAINQDGAQRDNNYVDMHTAGIGYLRRVREVPVRKGKPFMSASISAFHGEKGSNDMVYVPFDVKAASAQSQEVLEKFKTQANDETLQVLVRFKIGDQYIDTFNITKGKRAGQIGFCLKGRLLQITHVWIKAKGEQSYTRAYEKPGLQQQAQPAELPEAQAPEAEANGTNG
jgi:hypothetical protein